MRNIGARAAKGEYLAFLDSDDLWKSEKLAMKVGFFQANPDLKICHCREEWIRNNRVVSQSDLGKLTVDPDTTVAVYWSRLSRDFPRYPHWLIRKLWSIFSSFRLFFLDWFETYLVMADFPAVEYRPDLESYRVPGIDQKGNEAVSYIKQNGVIEIETDEGPGQDYARLVIETYDPAGFGQTDTYLTLYDDSATPQVIVQPDGGHPYGSHIYYAVIDFTEGVTPGRYYIQVKKGTQGSSLDLDYAIRVPAPDTSWDLLSNPGPTPGNVSTDPNDPGDDGVDGNGKPTSPVTINLVDTQYHLLSPEGSDIDWFELILP